MQKHLAIFKGEVGEDILSGKKTIESRFSKAKNPPFGVISSGDLVYIKPSGKDIIGQFRVKKVIFFDGFEENDLNQLKEGYKNDLAVGEGYWEKNKNARFGTLIFIGNCTRFITSPIKIKKSDLRGWVVLTT
ncbi:hypothetical protein HY383_02425 [Candidatus Daviesbacteria bacterium]|nr:hypothetical protein [Candidatus Daviesbacteria bacterium]